MALIFIFTDGGRISVRAVDADDALATMHATLAKNGVRDCSYGFGKSNDRLIVTVPLASQAFHLAGCVRV